MNNQENINKIIELLDSCWEKHPTSNQSEVDAKENLRKEIENLKQNGLKTLAEQAETYLTEKTAWLAKQTELEEAKKATETALTAEKKKLSEDLVKKLEDLSTGKDLPEEKLTELKTLLTNLKDSKAEVKFTEADRKELVKEIQKEQPTNYWSIGACLFAIPTFLIATGFGIFSAIKSKEAK